MNAHSRTQHSTKSTRKAHSRKEVADTLGLSVRTIDNLLADGTLKKVKVGRRTLVLASSVDALLGAA